MANNRPPYLSSKPAGAPVIVAAKPVEAQETPPEAPQEEREEPAPLPVPPATPVPVPTRVPSHWEDFDGQAVVVQLKTPMLLVTYPNQVIEQAEGELATTTYLRGVCSVREPDLYRNIEITLADPYHAALVTRTIVPLDEIRYITRVDAR
jgi:hypothetical protein